MKGSGRRRARRQCPQRLQPPGQARPSGTPPPAEQLGVRSPPSVRRSLSASPAGAGASGSAPGAGGTVPPRAGRSHPRAALPAQARRCPWRRPRRRRTQSPGPEGRGSPSGSGWGQMGPWLAARGWEPAPPASAGQGLGPRRGEPRGRSRSRRGQGSGVAACSGAPGPPAAGTREAGVRRRPLGVRDRLRPGPRRRKEKSNGRHFRGVSSGRARPGPAPSSVPGGPFRIPLASGRSVRLLVPGARPRQGKTSGLP